KAATDLTGGGAQAVMRVMRNLLAHLPLTSCYVAWFLTGHGLVPVHGPWDGDPLP
ncbi:hypothetical protein K5549_020800, partial [Capra hircus]|uniref:Uncharacterized protein n=1 Tax=Capra hircus TaxID=9925 RepID=A0A452G0K7_CAPHI